MTSLGCEVSLVFTSHPGFCSQDLTLKLCLIRSICMISQAIYNGVKCGDFIFSRKAELVAQMVVRASPGGWPGLGLVSRTLGEVPNPPCWGLSGGGGCSISGTVVWVPCGQGGYEFALLSPVPACLPGPSGAGC